MLESAQNLIRKFLVVLAIAFTIAIALQAGADWGFFGDPSQPPIAGGGGGGGPGGIHVLFIDGTSSNSLLIDASTHYLAIDGVTS